MAFRTLTIDSPAELHVRRGQLTVQRPSDEKPLHIDLDDLACIVLANLDITLSTGAINMISQHGITVLGVGRNFMPTSILLPFARNSRYSQIVDLQLGMSASLKKRLWQRIVKQKIVNQAEVLAIAEREGYEDLVAIAHDVRSGDPDNREAVAARFYFPHLKDGYTREEVSSTSSILNYGYAVVRSTLARSVVSHGFITSVGLHHGSVRNEFNLVDDLIEPFRAMVDLQMLAIDLDGEDPESLSRNARREMTTVLRNACLFDGRKTSCLIAIEETVISLMRAIEQRDPKLLLLPRALPIEKVV
ncbi:MAG: type II CRISPR-associated endonuclease Cas1 [Coriobacteriia bacterium]|nr:type II CRISPR-associated endonuclease Cas1 [Coriobacteriia bacterium]